MEATLVATPSKSVSYDFALERKSCKGVVVETKSLTAQISLISNELDYSTNQTSNYFIDVITDKTIGLSHICTEILDTSTSLETKIISNAEILSNRIYLVALTTDDKAFDTIQLNTKTANATGGFNPLNTQVISLYTDLTQVSDSKNIGVEKERSQYVLCVGREYTIQKETFVRSVFL